MNKQLENKLSSREVCEMMEMEHKNLLKKIDDINKDFGSSKVSHEKYWTEGTFENRGKEYREFQITKKGCEFLAHKTTGTKGNLFTDRYMDKFAAMENVIQGNIGMPIQGMAEAFESMVGIGQYVQVLGKFTMGLKEYVQDSIQAKDHQIDQAMELIGIRSKNTHRLTGKLKDALYNKYGDYVNATDIRYINAKYKVFKDFKVSKWEDISVTKYNAVEAFIENMFD